MNMHNDVVVAISYFLTFLMVLIKMLVKLVKYGCVLISGVKGALQALLGSPI